MYKNLLGKITKNIVGMKYIPTCHIVLVAKKNISYIYNSKLKIHCQKLYIILIYSKCCF